MKKELYDVLKIIEDILYVIAIENGEMHNSKLGHAWALLYKYLEEKDDIDL